MNWRETPKGVLKLTGSIERMSSNHSCLESPTSPSSKEDKGRAKRDTLFVDLEFHLRKYPVRDKLLDVLSTAADVIAITGRGSNWGSMFELDYATLVASLGELRRWRTLSADELRCHLQDRNSGRNLLLLKGQEVFTREGFDVVVVGSREDFEDFTPMAEIRTRTEKRGILILGHPFLVPNTLVLRLPSSRRLKEAFEAVDIVDGFGPYTSLLPSPFGRVLGSLSSETGRPLVAVSDRHLYRALPQRLEPFGLAVEGLNVNLETGVFLSELKAALINQRFRLPSTKAPSSLLDLASLSVRELVYLCRFLPDSLLTLLGLQRKRGTGRRSHENARSRAATTNVMH